MVVAVRGHNLANPVFPGKRLLAIMKSEAVPGHPEQVLPHRYFGGSQTAVG
ncbi:hypothetical protein MYX78_03460 [Acidobacteria bacterium AH-259-G07]|nr:hypothetical protein [Acidobacteria bacterium AH-259-G07]